MAITLIQDPTSTSPSRLHCPAYNDQWFTATSNQTAQPNFQFYVTTTIHYYNGTAWTTKVYNDALNNPPDGILRFNVRAYTETFIKHHIPLSTASWSRCTNGCLKVVVNVGERYGSTPTIYTGTNKTYYVWNAGLSFNEDVGFTPTNYINSNGSAFNLLNDQPDDRLNYYQNGYCYMIAGADNVFKQAVISTTDGLFTGTFTIANPYYNTGNWYDRYVCFNLNPYYLASTGGASWIAVSGTTVTVEFQDNTNTTRKTVTYTFDGLCSKFYKYSVLYLNNKGAFDWMGFELVSEEEYAIERTKVRMNPYTDPSASGAMALLNSTAETATYTTQYIKNLKLNTNWITETQSNQLRALVTSPIVYVQDIEVSSNQFNYPAISSDNKYKRLRNFNGKLFNLVGNFEIAQTSYRQKGI